MDFLRAALANGGENICNHFRLRLCALRATVVEPHALCAGFHVATSAIGSQPSAIPEILDQPVRVPSHHGAFRVEMVFRLSLIFFPIPDIATPTLRGFGCRAPPPS